MFELGVDTFLKGIINFFYNTLQNIEICYSNFTKSKIRVTKHYQVLSLTPWKLP